jgi:hypothetical protein
VAEVVAAASVGTRRAKKVQTFSQLIKARETKPGASCPLVGALAEMAETRGQGRYTVAEERSTV